MRLLTPQSVFGCKSGSEFDDDGRMKPSPFYNRIVDVMEEAALHAADTRYS